MEHEIKGYRVSATCFAMFLVVECVEVLKYELQHAFALNLFCLYTM